MRRSVGLDGTSKEGNVGIQYRPLGLVDKVDRSLHCTRPCEDSDASQSVGIGMMSIHSLWTSILFYTRY